MIGRSDGRLALTTPREASTIGQYRVGVNISSVLGEYGPENEKWGSWSTCYVQAAGFDCCYHVSVGCVCVMNEGYLG